MCQNLYASFARSDGSGITGCTVNTTDAVQVRCHVEFTGAEVGQQFYARMIAKQPDGNFYVWYTNPVTVQYAYTFVTPDLPISSLPGIWSIYFFQIYNSSNVVVCEGSGTGSGSCESINVQTSAGGCTAFSNCVISCPGTIIQGQDTSINISWSGGYAPYSVKIYDEISNTPYATLSGITGTSTSVIINTNTTNISTGSHTLYAFLSDSCPGNTQSCNANCPVTIQSAPSPCTTPSVIFSMT